MHIEKRLKTRVQNDVLHTKNPNLSNSQTLTLSVPNIKEYILSILERILNIIH